MQQSLNDNFREQNDAVRDKINSDLETVTMRKGQTALVHKGQLIDYFTNGAAAQNGLTQRKLPLEGSSFYIVGGPDQSLKATEEKATYSSPLIVNIK